MKSETSSKSRLFTLKWFQLRSHRALSFNFYSGEIYGRVIEYKTQWPSSFAVSHTKDVLLLCSRVLCSIVAKPMLRGNLHATLVYLAFNVLKLLLLVSPLLLIWLHAGKLFHRMGRLLFIFTHVDIDETISNSAHVARVKETIVMRLSSAKNRIKEIMNFYKQTNGKWMGMDK